MDIVSGIVVYLIIWWTIFFMVLPFGVRSQIEAGSTVSGSEPGAPALPQLKKKALITSLIAAGLWLLVFLNVQFQFITLDDIPLWRDLSEPVGS